MPNFDNISNVSHSHSPSDFDVPKRPNGKRVNKFGHITNKAKRQLETGNRKRTQDQDTGTGEVFMAISK